MAAARVSAPAERETSFGLTWVAPRSSALVAVRRGLGRYLCAVSHFILRFTADSNPTLSPHFQRVTGYETRLQPSGDETPTQDFGVLPARATSFGITDVSL